MSVGFDVVACAYEWLDEALNRVDDDVVLTSPFLSHDICARIASAKRRCSSRFRLYTNLDASAVANGYLHIQGLKLLLVEGVELYHVDRLHAKCFIVGAMGMLGSANLTGAGLGSSARSNRELGVALNAVQLVQARDVIESWPAELITRERLDATVESAKRLTVVAALSVRLDHDVALPLVERLLVDARDGGRRLWVKLEYGEPGLGGWRKASLFASPKKGKPGIRVGDLVLICAKETHDCYAIVEVTGDPEFLPADYVAARGSDRESVDRWPWVNRTKPRLVPEELLQLKLSELGIKGQGLQNGHCRLEFDTFTNAVRALARLAT